MSHVVFKQNSGISDIFARMSDIPLLFFGIVLIFGAIRDIVQITMIIRRQP